MLLRDIGLDVYRVVCTNAEEGIQQCTFIFKCDNPVETV